MPITFNEIPATQRALAVMVEADASKAMQGVPLKPFKVLLLGQKKAAGTLAQKTKAPVRSADQVRAFAGEGSIAHNMAVAYYQQRTRVDDVDLVLLDDNGAGVAAALTLTVSVNTPLAGTIPLMIAGRRIPTLSAAGTTANQIATDLRAQINAVEGLPVTASGTGAAVTITSDHKGIVGNEIAVRIGYDPNDALPSGVTISGAGVLTGGTSNPSIDAATLTAIGEVQYDIIVHPWTDTVNMATLATELASRFGALRQIGGRAIAAKRDTSANLGTYGNALNSPHLVVFGSAGQQNPPWERAARAAARIAFSLQNDPALPVWTLELDYEVPELETDRFDQTLRNLLYNDGISGTTVDSGGVVRTDRVITTYQTSPAGAPDDSWLDINVPAIFDFIRWDIIRLVRTKFARAKLAKDGTIFGAGQQIVTPAIMRAELISEFILWESLGLVEDREQFKRDLIVEIDQGDPTRLNVLLPPNFVNGLAVTAVKLQFRK